jgi:hypothetical protein
MYIATELNSHAVWWSEKKFEDLQMSFKIRNDRENVSQTF